MSKWKRQNVKKPTVARSTAFSSINDDEAEMEAMKELGLIEPEEVEEEYEEEYYHEPIHQEVSSNIRPLKYQEKLSANNTVNEARVRIEQARIYEMFMSEDIFENVDANEQAIAKVKEEFYDFATERLEVLLGMRSDNKNYENVSSPFNSLEVEALKDLAYKLSKGETQKGKNETVKPSKLGLSKSAPAPKQPLVSNKNSHVENKNTKVENKAPSYNVVKKEKKEDSVLKGNYKKALPEGYNPPLEEVNYAPNATSGGNSRTMSFGSSSQDGGTTQLNNLLAKALGAVPREEVYE